MGCLMAPTPPNYGRPTGDSNWGQAGAPNPVVPPVPRRAPGGGAPGNVDFTTHVVQAEPPRKAPNKRVVASVAGAAGVVLLLCCGIAGAQSLGGDTKDRVTFTVTHIPAPSTTTHTTTATVTKSPPKSPRSKKDRKAKRKSTSAPTSVGE